ncbi:MAG: molybdopterin molybdotransferase MoeA [Bacteroidetes bacterium]|nr:molybdopterin molybdotransferase MoeA [Bacteroidota bacterium]
MIDFRQAQALLLEKAHSFGREELPLAQAFGRVLSEPIHADRDYPPFPRATMDGYALRHADLGKGIRKFKVVETIYAGGVSAHTILEGECFRIMTGAAVPESASIVIRREVIEEGPVWVTLLDKEEWRPFQNIAARGEDLNAGDLVIDRNCRCEPAIMGLLATLGRESVQVERLPSITLLTTGNEVVPVGAPVGPVQIRNSNRWLLEAALRKEGVGLRHYAHVPDEPETLQRQLKEALLGDLVILCGGVSAGDADYVPGVLEKLGVKNLFHKIAMRPGKPTWCGYAPQGAMVFALPGNPFSCLVNTILLIRPFLQACFNLSVEEPLGLPIAVPRKKKAPLDEFFPARLSGAPATVEPVTLNGSGDIRLGREANLLALHPADRGDLQAGNEILCYSFV